MTSKLIPVIVKTITHNGDNTYRVLVDLPLVGSETPTPYEFDTQKGQTPALSKIDDTHYLCSYAGSGDDGWTVVLTADPTTWAITKGTSLEYDTSKGKVPALEKIDNNHHLCAYQGNNDDGWSVVLEEGLKVRP